MVLTPPILPMLARAQQQLPNDNILSGLVAEQKLDGFRAIIFARSDLVRIQSRQGADLTGAFPDLRAAAVALEEDLVLDGELVVFREGKLDFVALQQRARRRGRTAAAAIRDQPAHLIVFDVLEAVGVNLLSLPYRQRRARLKDLFERGVLAAPFVLCPATTDRAVMEDWLDPAWAVAGGEGVVLKGREQPYLPGKRLWIKVRARETAEAVVGGVTGSLRTPATLLLGSTLTARTRSSATASWPTKPAAWDLACPTGPR
ncbi:ATP-dependent DNA ligase, partial [Streptomyces sp. NPDC058228]|uniref:ATP-dependent DNA ligase n=1 Tax=Streptomyces sp. NPDC058228 TaxID=3346390 RepID=UPI0036E315B5